MRNNLLALPSRRWLMMFAGVYAVMMLYGSTVIGPAGLHFVYRNPVTLFGAFLHTPYVHHGSDQRADWVGNMLMLVPFGFLVSGSVWPRRTGNKALSMLAALALCSVTVLTIKYIQLFFPPRTVTLNYILAQTIGSGIGCLACIGWQERIVPYSRGRDLAGTLVVVLALYGMAISLFVLMPLDFALNSTDLAAAVARLPSTGLTLPGEGRPLVVRVAVIAMGALAFLPVGMLLTFVREGVYRVRRPIVVVAGWGVVLTSGLYFLSLLVISSSPVMASILYRSFGIVLGAALLHWLVQQNADVMRARLRALVPWMVPPYLLALLLVNRLVSSQWESWHFVVVHTYRLGLIPLFDYYIVSKAQAAKNIVGHFALYAPIGFMIWLWYGDRSVARAFVTAALLSFAIEAARYFRPGLEGDVNAVVVAGVSAMLTTRLMPAGWAMWEAVVRQSARGPVRQWNKRGSTPITMDRSGGQLEGDAIETVLPSDESANVASTLADDAGLPGTGIIENY